MIIRDFNFARIAVAPDEANAPLVIDSDAVLAFAIATQCFQAVPWRRS